MYFTKKYLIALDSKARLVLPLEIRDALGVRKNEKILFSVSATTKTLDSGLETITIELAKAPEKIDGMPCSKNCKTVRGEQQ